MLQLTLLILNNRDRAALSARVVSFAAVFCSVRAGQIPYSGRMDGGTGKPGRAGENYVAAA